jgi:hypothetical protein
MSDRPARPGPVSDRPARPGPVSGRPARPGQVSRRPARPVRHPGAERDAGRAQPPARRARRAAGRWPGRCPKHPRVTTAARPASSPSRTGSCPAGCGDMIRNPPGLAAAANQAAAELCCCLDVLPAVNSGDSSSAAHVALWWVPASLAAARSSGLTPPPQAFRLSLRPRASTFFAALWSRSCRVPHAVQVHSRTCSGLGPSLTPHAEHTWLVGSNRPIFRKVRPCWAAFSSTSCNSCDRKHSRLRLQPGCCPVT